jgi:hypothetical protein
VTAGGGSLSLQPLCGPCVWWSLGGSIVPCPGRTRKQALAVAFGDGEQPGPLGHAVERRQDTQHGSPSVRSGDRRRAGLGAAGLCRRRWYDRLCVHAGRGAGGLITRSASGSGVPAGALGVFHHACRPRRDGRRETTQRLPVVVLIIQTTGSVTLDTMMVEVAMAPGVRMGQ